ncbi:hypothetical protein BHE74_00013450 [Ensete ventricosum]|nr:hypothetical protein GW17_00029170 [Ensete ventricosum]RWW78327.1 hypothetical protein BHE74_00013450 [Ensete ventricosum]RZR92731.1 hypothetical protein BHM03_00021085 [Ensete ventricosum]
MAAASTGPRDHIERIRRERYSIGREEKNPLAEDIHQAVSFLSEELYSKDVHFLMELIQVVFILHTYLYPHMTSFLRCLPEDQYTDCPLPGGTLDLAPYRTIRGCFCLVVAQNKSVTINFDRRRLLPGGISLVAAREKEE